MWYLAVVHAVVREWGEIELELPLAKMKADL